MAILHPAQLVPSKSELLAAYLPTRTELGVAAGSDITLLGAYRFDDPAGEVGIETHLVSTAEGAIVHMPLTYRSAPVADGALVSTMEHSVLGPRWVYDGCSDPVYVGELLRAILTGGSQVDQFIEMPDGPVRREPTAFVHGSGDPDAAVPSIDTVRVSREGTTSVIEAGGVEIVVRHLLGDVEQPAGGDHLTCTWAGVDDPVVLAVVR